MTQPGSVRESDTRVGIPYIYAAGSEDESTPQTVLDLDYSDILYENLYSSNFVLTFATALVGKVVPDTFDHQTMRTFLLELPDALVDFVDKVSCNGTDACKAIADATWQRKNDIVSAVCEISEKAELDAEFRESSSTNLTRIIRNAITGKPTNMTCANLIEMFPSYWWLVGRLRRVFVLNTTTGGAMHEVEIGIDQFARRRWTSHSSSGNEYGEPALYEVTFILDWDLRVFLGKQVYSGHGEDIIDRVITLTGSSIEAQALGCAQYMQQTWPSGGGCVLTLVKLLMKHFDEKGQAFPLEIGEQNGEIRLSGSINDLTLTVSARGLRESIVRIGQQLCWLGAALRSSPIDDRLAYCRPVLRKVDSLSGLKSFRIRFEISEWPTLRQFVNGECWHKLFKNAVVVQGFPIRRRHSKSMGLEIPLNVLGRLTPSRWVTEFDRKVYIKGHSSILVPTKADAETVVWHLVSNDDGRHISYVDPQIAATPGLYPGLVECNLNPFRHVVGWCSTVATLAGSPIAEYDIEWSGLTKVDEGCGLAGATISRGTAIAHLDVPAVGTKDMAFGSDLGEYLRRLQWVAKQYVVLYDVGDSRAWLIDGATALLHLLRASMVFSSAEDVMGEFVFGPEELQEAPLNTAGCSASIAVLNSPQNLLQRLYRAIGETFQDRVEEIYHLLEKVFAHQLRTKFLREAGMVAGRLPQAQLEGFDFMDLAGDTDHFSARMIEPPGKSPRWFGFTQSINAPILFGRGFGDLLMPRCNVNICSSWTTAPSGKDYLAVRVEDIAAIMRKKGNNLGSPWRIVDSIYWHMPDKIFERCAESRHEPGDRCNYAQVMVSEEETRKSAGRIVSPTGLEPHGAIIFDGAPFCDPSSSLGVPLSSTSTASHSPAIDSGISVGYGSTSGDSATSTIAKGKRPVDAGTPLSDDGKRRCREPSGLSAEESQAAAAGGDEASQPDETLSNPRALAALRRAVKNFEGQIDAFYLTAEAEVGSAPVDPGDYTVGWICALQVELSTARRMLDRVHARGFGHGMDCNLYILGQIGNLNVVLTCLPKGQYGNNIAAVVATRMINRFPMIEIGLMVGIGGGLSSAKNDVRLGDVVVGTGVVQYDMGKFTNDGFIATGCVKTPPEKLLHVLNYMAPHGSSITGQLQIAYPGAELDQLYAASYPHVGGATCETCDREQTVQRSILRDSTTPHVFYGTIASGNSVIKDAKTRETLIEKHGVVCCEMEAAGLMNTRFPCLVIRGISDYADSHKNDIWIPYAAAAAAQYARDMLLAMPADIALSDRVAEK
ncbi:hypothetical protein BJY00DRAFT_316023 [Aspergillus carlsbadensis]|nr:hypothetical protein BJY00DRAFT_316023 [Aspergillus carlsbadensis]